MAIERIGSKYGIAGIRALAFGGVILIQGCGGSTVVTQTNRASQTVIASDFGEPASAPNPMYCASNMSYLCCESDLYYGGGYRLFVPSEPLRPLISLSQVLAVNRMGYALCASGSGVSLIDPSLTQHVVTSSVLAGSAYALNDEGLVMYATGGSGANNAQFYVQPGWDSSRARAISRDVQGSFLNNAGVIIGTSYGLNTIPAGSPVVFYNGHESTLPLVKGAESQEVV